MSFDSSTEAPSQELAVIGPTDTVPVPGSALPSLPPEVWRQISVFVVAEPKKVDLFWSPKKNPKLYLANFGRACKEFLGLVLPILYKDVSFAAFRIHNRAERFAAFSCDALETNKFAHVRQLRPPRNIKVADLKNIVEKCRYLHDLHLDYSKTDVFNSALRMLKKKAPVSLTRITLELSINGTLKALEMKPAVALPDIVRHVRFEDIHYSLIRPLLALIERSPHVESVEGLPCLSWESLRLSLSRHSNSLRLRWTSNTCRIISFSCRG